MKHFFRILGLLLFFPLIAFAEGVEDYYINATVETDGSLLVEEYFTLSGSYNGYERIINYRNNNATPFNINANSYGGSTIHNGNGLEVLEVGGADHYFKGNFNNLSIDNFTYDDEAQKGDYGVYNYEATSNGKDIMIYNPSRKGKAFYLKYRLKNMAILFNDIGEIGWNVVGDAFKEDIESLTITLNVPGNTSELKAWAHGPLNGLITVDSKEKATFTISNLSAYTSIDIRSTFNPSVIVNSTKKYDTNALDKILVYEEEKAEEANELRRQNEAKNETVALNYLNTFKNDITRENYRLAYNAINILMEGATKTSYLEELKIYKEKLDIIEEENATKALEKLEQNLNMNNYSEASRAISVLDNTIKIENFQEQLKTLYIKLEQKEKRNDNIRWTGAIALMLYTGYLTAVIYKNFKKDPEVDFNNDYLREIPDTATPEDVSYLFDKNISDKAMSASIMDLIRRKVITQEKIDAKNYRLILHSDIPISVKDSKLVKVIFGSKAEITTKEMKKNARSSYNSVINYYNSYKKQALSDASDRKYYEDNIDKEKINSNWSFKPGIILTVVLLGCIFPPIFILAFMILIGYGIYKYIKGFKTNTSGSIITTNLIVIALISLGLSIYILIANLMYKTSVFGYLLLLLIVICVGVWYAIPSKRTYEGALAYKKWKALEKFLKDFGSFADKEVPEIALWEKYLVYATLFGCAKEVSKVMDMRFKEYNTTGIDYYDSWVTSYYINDLISSSVRTSVVSAQSAKAASESSSSSGSWSSGSGGGGGFSSGGGSFGGGGGGGRF